VFYFYQILTTFNKLSIVVEFVLFLSNTDHLQQVDDCEGGQYLIQVKQTLPQSSTCWRWSVFDRNRTHSTTIINLILTTFNKLMIVVEFVLFLSNTDHLQQVDDCGRVCSISIKYWPPSTGGQYLIEIEQAPPQSSTCWRWSACDRNRTHSTIMQKVVN
jgi:hypothetical protein